MEAAKPHDDIQPIETADQSIEADDILHPDWRISDGTFSVNSIRGEAKNALKAAIKQAQDSGFTPEERAYKLSIVALKTVGIIPSDKQVEGEIAERIAIVAQTRALMGQATRENILGELTDDDFLELMAKIETEANQRLAQLTSDVKRDAIKNDMAETMEKFLSLSYPDRETVMRKIDPNIPVMRLLNLMKEPAFGGVPLKNRDIMQGLFAMRYAVNEINNNQTD